MEFPRHLSSGQHAEIIRRRNASSRPSPAASGCSRIGQPTFAARLAANFAGQPNVCAVQGAGTKIDFEPADVIYANAGVTRPVDVWLDRLKDGGRLILALTRDKDAGGAWFFVERRGDGFLAKSIFAGDIFPCEGARDAESERALAAALDKGGWVRVTRLYRSGDIPEEQCWLKGPGWALAYE
jgi:protein-L-isoaspartate(D-aspartate) O-methyltransferase